MFPWTILEDTVLVFESKIVEKARVHARTHATQYRIPSIYFLRCPNATYVQTSAQYVPCRNHERRWTLFADRSKSDKWLYHMEVPLVCTMHGAHLINHIMSLGHFRSFAIPNEHIHQCPGGQWTNPNNVAESVHGNRYFVCTTGILWIEKTSQRMPPSNGHAIHILCDKIRKLWDGLSTHRIPATTPPSPHLGSIPSGGVHLL